MVETIDFTNKIKLQCLTPFTEGSSFVFQSQLGDILRRNNKLALQFLHSILDKLNTVFSEFIGMVQQVSVAKIEESSPTYGEGSTISGH